MKFVAGLNRTLVPTMFAVLPPGGIGLTLTIVKAWPSGSESFAKTGIVTAVFAGVEAVSFNAAGGRLVTAVMTGALTLFVTDVSTVELPTAAKLVTIPCDAVVTVKIRLVEPPAARSPRINQMT